MNEYSKFKESSIKVRTLLVNFHPSKSPDVIFVSNPESSPGSSPSSSPGSNPGLINRYPRANLLLAKTLPEIWDKMATDMRTLTKYGDQILL